MPVYKIKSSVERQADHLLLHHHWYLHMLHQPRVPTHLCTDCLVTTDSLEQCMMIVGHKQPGLTQGTEATASVGELDTPDGTVLQHSMGDLKWHNVKTTDS